jgi:hypothetical protein
MRYHAKNWITTLRTEDKEKDTNTLQFSALSQKFKEYGFLPSSDSTKVFVELGYLKRSNDSKIT